MELTFDGSPRVLAALQRLGTGALVAAESALLAEAEEILAESQGNYVPIDEGDLRDSGFVEPPRLEVGGVSVSVGYSAPYALVVHENPRSGKTGGISPSGRRYAHWARTGGWKYLEEPWKLATLGMAERLALRLEAAGAVG